MFSSDQNGLAVAEELMVLVVAAVSPTDFAAEWATNSIPTIHFDLFETELGLRLGTRSGVGGPRGSAKCR